MTPPLSSDGSMPRLMALGSLALGSLALGVLGGCWNQYRPDWERKAQCDQLGRAQTWEDWDEALGCAITRPAAVCDQYPNCQGTLALGSARGEDLKVELERRWATDGGWEGELLILHLPTETLTRAQDKERKCNLERTLFGCTQRCYVSVDAERGRVISSRYFTADENVPPFHPVADGGHRSLFDDYAARCEQWK